MTGSAIKTGQEAVAVRGSTHGSYAVNAAISQKLKSVMRGSDGWSNLSASQKESLDLMSTKIARILAGDPNFEEHWIDLEGYSSLGKSK